MGDTEQNNAGEAQEQEQPQEQPQEEQAPPQEQPPEGEPKPGEGEAGEGAEDKPSPTPAPEPEPEEKHKRAGGWQRRIERLEREREMLLERLTNQQGGQQPKKEKTPEENAEDYIDALVEKRLAARAEQERQAKTQADFARRTAEVRAAHPDFDEVVMSVDAPVSQALQQALLTSEQGPEIMYQLAKSPAELARLSALQALDAAREIGRLEAKLASATAAPPKPKPASRPPAPPTTMNGSSASTRSLDDLPISEYKRAYRSGRR